MDKTKFFISFLILGSFITAQDIVFPDDNEEKPLNLFDKKYNYYKFFF